VLKVFLLIWAGVIAGLDLKTRRIPNAALLLVLVPAVLALVVNGKGLLGVSSLQSLGGFLVAALMLPGYYWKQMGAGDVKLVACLGGLLGFAGGLELLLVGFSFLGLISLAVWFMQRWGFVLPKRIPASPAFVAAFGIQLCMGRILTGMV